MITGYRRKETASVIISWHASLAKAHSRTSGWPNTMSGRRRKSLSRFQLTLHSEGSLRAKQKLPDLKHPNIVSILDCDTRFADSPYIVMPYYSAGSLRKLIDEHPEGLNERRVIGILGCVLRGLQVAHSAGIGHRDIK